MAPRIRLQENKRTVEMEAGGDRCACFTLILCTEMKRKQEQMTEKDDVMEGEKKSKQRSRCQNGPHSSTNRQSPE